MITCSLSLLLSYMVMVGVLMLILCFSVLQSPLTPPYSNLARYDSHANPKSLTNSPYVKKDSAESRP